MSRYLSLLLLGPAACGSGDDATDSGDADTDTDTDTDTDADADSDTDADSDADADTGDTGDTGGVACTPNAVFPVDDGAADFRLGGTAAGYAGHDLALVDLDGDGTDDLAVGGYEVAVGPTYGRVWVSYGALAVSGTLDTVSDATLDATSTSQAKVGKFVAGLGDRDGDGSEDLGVVAEDSSRGGAVYLFYGDPARLAGGAAVNTAAAWFESSVGTGGNLGQGLVGLGDVDADGFEDVAFAEPSSGTGGAVFLLAGSPTRSAGALDEGALPRVDPGRIKPFTRGS